MIICCIFSFFLAASTASSDLSFSFPNGLGFEILKYVSFLFTILLFSCCIFSFFIAASAPASDLSFAHMFTSC